MADSDTPELRKYGDKRFQMIAADLLKEPHKYKARVTIKHLLTHCELRGMEEGGEAEVKGPHCLIHQIGRAHL